MLGSGREKENLERVYRLCAQCELRVKETLIKQKSLLLGLKQKWQRSGKTEERKKMSSLCSGFFTHFPSFPSVHGWECCHQPSQVQAVKENSEVEGYLSTLNVTTELLKFSTNFRKSGKPYGKSFLSTLGSFEKQSPRLGSLVYCKSSTLDHAAIETITPLATPSEYSWLLRRLTSYSRQASSLLGIWLTIACVSRFEKDHVVWLFDVFEAWPLNIHKVVVPPALRHELSLTALGIVLYLASLFKGHRMVDYLCLLFWTQLHVQCWVLRFNLISTINYSMLQVTTSFVVTVLNILSLMTPHRIFLNTTAKYFLPRKVPVPLHSTRTLGVTHRLLGGWVELCRAWGRGGWSEGEGERLAEESR
uniref:Uncharacterized protein n=1 Tax=Timema douglasi TaxID=61478 RepID=A0A7R8VQK1_TIMDO|nr:unnamed protein product [Timema douglasi]